ncbi:hypothetical protein HOP50_04g28440 [Chloropicon primus]|nr:hypothetical protein HOP50_04g28440 [Chloropicon primus]|mmetsp:Transcript_2242/g.6109  ORF Transcript_2242/g.6109 Transcript_2242/m.6109 type:complete len:296 (-) Transcript_2242:217-1104(-)
MKGGDDGEEELFSALSERGGGRDKIFRFGDLPGRLQTSLIRVLLEPLLLKSERGKKKVGRGERTDLWVSAIRCFRFFSRPRGDAYSTCQSACLCRMLVASGASLSVKASQNLMGMMKAAFVEATKQQEQRNSVTLGMVVEVAAACLALPAHENIPLLYSIVYNSDIIAEMRKHDGLLSSSHSSQPAFRLLEQTSNFFSSLVDSLGAKQLDLKQVQEIIASNVGEWARAVPPALPPVEISCLLEEHHDGQIYFTVFDSSTSSTIHFAHESKAKVGTLALDLDDSDRSQATAFADLV